MKCLKNELAKMIRKQIKQLQNRRERLKVSEEKLKSAEDKTALLKAGQVEEADRKCRKDVGSNEEFGCHVKGGGNVCRSGEKSTQQKT